MPGGFADETGFLKIEVVDKERDILIMVVTDKSFINLNVGVDAVDFLMYLNSFS